MNKPLKIGEICQNKRNSQKRIKFREIYCVASMNAMQTLEVFR